MSVLIFDITGTMRFIYDDESAEIAQAVGDLKIRRASHVEPITYTVGSDPTVHHGWSADMKPVKGPFLGPYKKRQDALDAEVAWLKSHDVPVPEETTNA
jgi:hypothetical protein